MRKASRAAVAPPALAVAAVAAVPRPAAPTTKRNITILKKLLFVYLYSKTECKADRAQCIESVSPTCHLFDTELQVQLLPETHVKIILKGQ
jgi:hypothetical protein